jgi:hypothetical protein
MARLAVEPAPDSGLDQTLTFRFTDEGGPATSVVDVPINSVLDVSRGVSFEFSTLAQLQSLE